MMSKQQDEVTRILSLLYPDLMSEVTLDKITGVIPHKTIRVDIWIPSIRCVVEVHGIQHHKPSGFGKNNIDTHLTFMDQQFRDTKLKKVCDMFEINYEQIDYNQKVDMATIFTRFKAYEQTS
jgi:hypothetical protein